MPTTDDPSQPPPSDDAVQPTHRSSDRSLVYPSVARSVVGGLVAIAVILSGIVVINLLTRDKKSPSPAAVKSPSTAGAALRSSTAAKPGAAASKPTPRSPSTPAGRGSVKPSAAPKPSAPAGPAAAQPSSPQAAAARIPLAVLNSSRIRGLAKSAASDFRAAGWSVPGKPGNTSYRATITTVYYLAGQEAAARQLMRDVPRVRRMLLRPRVLPGHVLTVVVTREYAGR